MAFASTLEGGRSSSSRNANANGEKPMIAEAEINCSVAHYVRNDHNNSDSEQTENAEANGDKPIIAEAENGAKEAAKGRITCGKLTQDGKLNGAKAGMNASNYQNCETDVKKIPGRVEEEVSQEHKYKFSSCNYASTSVVPLTKREVSECVDKVEKYEYSSCTYDSSSVVPLTKTEVREFFDKVHKCKYAVGCNYAFNRLSGAIVDNGAQSIKPMVTYQCCHG